MRCMLYPGIAVHSTARRNGVLIEDSSHILPLRVTEAGLEGENLDLSNSNLTVPPSPSASVYGSNSNSSSAISSGLATLPPAAPTFGSGGGMALRLQTRAVSSVHCQDPVLEAFLRRQPAPLGALASAALPPAAAVEALSGSSRRGSSSSTSSGSGSAEQQLEAAVAGLSSAAEWAAEAHLLPTLRALLRCLQYGTGSSSSSSSSGSSSAADSATTASSGRSQMWADPAARHPLRCAAVAALLNVFHKAARSAAAGAIAASASAAGAGAFGSGSGSPRVAVAAAAAAAAAAAVGGGSSAAVSAGNGSELLQAWVDLLLDEEMPGEGGDAAAMAAAHVSNSSSTASSNSMC
jgi:hypothetical protein